MAKRSSRKKKPLSDDPNVAAFDAVRALTGQDEDEADQSEAELRSAAARILGKLGGSKGGKERARRLTKAQRAEIARKGAQARWKGHRKG